MEARSAGKLEMAAASWLPSVILESCRAWRTLAALALILSLFSVLLVFILDFLADLDFTGPTADRS